MKTIGEAIAAASRCLAEVGIEDPVRESEFLLAALLDTPRTHLLLNRREALNTEHIRLLRRWLRAREQRKPLAYISGEQPFRDLTLKVSPAVLVPRPETELVVEQALRILDRFPETVTVVDVGTGSGNIALSLALHRMVHLVIGIDRSAAALKVAAENQKINPHGAPVRWLKGNLLRPILKSRAKVSLIVANLPYVRSGVISELDPELQWEPRGALDGGPDGLRCIEPCIRQAEGVLLPGGVLVLEIGADQSTAVVKLFDTGAPWDDVQIFRDLAGLPRMVQARKRGL